MAFGTKVQNGNARKVTEPDFQKKIFWANLGQKLPKNRVFWTLCKIASLVFSDFWQKDRVQGTLKYGRKIFPEIFFSLQVTDFRYLGKFPYTICLLL